MSGPGIVVALDLPIPIHELTKHSTKAHADHPGVDLLMRQHGGRLLFITPDFAKVMGCWCGSCEGQVIDELERFDIWESGTFIVCRDCGNKRCPRASHHDNACTRSNEPGQVASRA